MTLSNALKQKNRLAGELVRLQQILLRENERRSDSTSTVDRQSIWDKIITVSNDLGVIKGKISEANIGIYSKLERMAELKSRISYLKTLPVHEGEEVVFVGRDQEKMVYTWNSFINQESIDLKVESIQEEINSLQDEVDLYNATTEIH